MDQIKEILKQAIKYRFWIALGVSALLPMIAYFVGVGPVQAEAAKAAGAIVQADKGVKEYASGVLPNQQYKGIVNEKTEELTKDVDESHKKLYERQAPLLTWPERVQPRFQKWGRKWPENVDASAVRFAVIDYVNAYPAFVHDVYESFKPFKPEAESGTDPGIVSAPPEDALLRPAKFTEQAPPDLGKVWAAQERLWIQRTLLDVVAKVNKGAKDWDSAVIKQINTMEVGNPSAQDQRSIAKGDALEEAPAINDPARPAEEAPAADTSSPMTKMGGMTGGPGSGGAAANNEAVFYIKSESDQFKRMPVEMTVLIDQNHIQDFLVGLENSPMNIQVMDFEMSRPTGRVTKPEKGAAMNTMGGMMGGGMMGGGMMDGGGMSRVAGFGGQATRANQQMQMPGMGGMGGAGGAAAPAAPKGIDARTKKRQQAMEASEESARKAVQSSLHDPYYNIVEVKIYGQARFFNPPAAETPAEPSHSETAAVPAEGETKAEGESEKKTDVKKAESPKAESEAEKKADETKADKKAESPKVDDRKAGSPKAESPKTDDKKAEKKADETKADKKAESPKTDDKKADGTAKDKAKTPKTKAKTDSDAPTSK